MTSYGKRKRLHGFFSLMFLRGLSIITWLALASPFGVSQPMFQQWVQQCVQHCAALPVETAFMSSSIAIIVLRWVSFFLVSVWFCEIDCLKIGPWSKLDHWIHPRAICTGKVQKLRSLLHRVGPSLHHPSPVYFLAIPFSGAVTGSEDRSEHGKMEETLGLEGLNSPRWQWRERERQRERERERERMIMKDHEWSWMIIHLSW